MTLEDNLPQLTGSYAGLWVKAAALAGLTAGLAGSVATSAAVSAWARLFEPRGAGAH